MNERIRELAEQADLYARSDNSSMLFDVWKKRYTEKFAELIVRECAHIGFNAAYPVKGVEVLTAIREHFGVE